MVSCLSWGLLNPSSPVNYFWGFSCVHRVSLGVNACSGFMNDPGASSGRLLSIGGHSWLGLFLISGGFWHVATQPFDALMRAFTWSGEAILGYSLSTLSLCSFTAAVLAFKRALSGVAIDRIMCFSCVLLIGASRIVHVMLAF